jgi:hypothetical protein
MVESGLPLTGNINWRFNSPRPHLDWIDIQGFLGQADKLEVFRQGLFYAIGSDSASFRYSRPEHLDRISQIPRECSPVEIGECRRLGNVHYTQESILALVRISALLHDQVELSDSSQAQFSEVLRSIVTYSTSPEYRPDVDVMSPLQKAVFDLYSSSTQLTSSLILSDLARFSLLAYEVDVPIQKGRPSHVAVSKACMPAMSRLLRRGKSNQLDDSTIIEVLKAYETPIRLRYGCPASCRFHDDPPLWRTVS